MHISFRILGILFFLFMAVFLYKEAILAEWQI